MDLQVDHFPEVPFPEVYLHVGAASAQLSLNGVDDPGEAADNEKFRSARPGAHLKPFAQAAVEPATCRRQDVNIADFIDTEFAALPAHSPIEAVGLEEQPLVGQEQRSAAGKAPLRPVRRQP